MQLQVVEGADKGPQAAMFLQESLSDVTVVASGGKRFPAHSQVLGFQSPVFMEQFQAGISLPSPYYAVVGVGLRVETATASDHHARKNRPTIVAFEIASPCCCVVVPLTSMSTHHQTDRLLGIFP